MAEADPHRPAASSALSGHAPASPLREKAGVRYSKVHDTRRTCGSLLAALDVHPCVAMQILRHSKIAITMEIHTEMPDARTREALRALGQYS